MASDRVEGGYPLDTSSQWGAAFPVPLDAAVERTAGGAVAPRCTPVFEPSFWNDGVDPVRRADPLSIQKRNNCYNYGTDMPSSVFAQPGAGGGTPVTVETCAARSAGAMADGLVPHADMTPCTGCCHLIALVVRPAAPIQDFHFYRRDADGTWSHKPGRTPATTLDNAGRAITDPRTADRGLYTDFCGFFCACKDSLSLAGPFSP